MDKPWKVISNADGVDEDFATLPEAIKQAESVLELWREQAQDDGEWDEDVEAIEVHLVTHAARITRRDGDNEDDGVEYGITEILGNELDEELRGLRAKVERLTADNANLRKSLAEELDELKHMVCCQKGQMGRNCMCAKCIDDRARELLAVAVPS